ncbi:hypothetical protein BDR04DRAFT_1156351 [Suillus decipiens]|nr:hypothetical protein BDR04DRAFT_1156351 [Suillus decipiens]
MFRTHDTDILPYWPFEVSVSEISESAVSRLQTYGDQNENILAATHISIVESWSHIPPTYEWGMEKQLHQRGVQIKELTCSKDGGVASLSHMWFHLTTVTITMWVHPPNKCLNLKSYHSAYYATAVLYPYQDNQGLQKVKCIFQHALENVHDAVVKHLQTEHVCVQALLASLQNNEELVPPK